MDELDERLGAVGRTVVDDAEVHFALGELVAAHSARRAKRRRAVVPAIVVGGVLVLAGCAAAIALRPWFDVTPDRLVISQDWYDLSGRFLASCETVWDLSPLTADAQAFVEDRLRERTPTDYGIDASSVPDKPPGKLSRPPLRTAEMLQGNFNAAVIRDVLTALRDSTGHDAASLTGESSCSAERQLR